LTVRTYMIDELQPDQVGQFKLFLKQEELSGPIEDIFWFFIPQELLTPEQIEHQARCGPFFFSLETGEDWLKLELLARCRGRIRCDCIRYATPDQRHWAIERLDAMLRSQDIPV
jgi:hypothetical protein